MDHPSWAQRYIGRQFVERGQSLPAYRCWDLVRDVLGDQFGVSLPALGDDLHTEADRTDIEALARGTARGWAEVPREDARAGDVVLLRVNGCDSHVGVVTSPGWMLHCRPYTDTCLEQYTGPRWGHRLAGIYRWAPSTALLPMIRLIAARHPLRADTEDWCLPAFHCLRQVVDWVLGRGADCAVQVDGVPIPEDDWLTVVPLGGEQVILRARVAGDDAGRIIGSFAALAASAYFGPVVGKMIHGAAWVSSTTTMMLYAAGQHAVNQIFPQHRPGTDPDDGRSHALQVTHNEMDPYGTIPVICGEDRVWPGYACRPYMEMVGEDAYFCALYVVGFAPLALPVNECKFGDTPLSSYAGYPDNIEIHDKGDATDAHALFPYVNLEQILDIELDQETSPGAWSESETEGPVDAIAVDLVYPQGLVGFQGDVRVAAAMYFDIEASPDDGQTWLHVDPGETFRVTGKSAGYRRVGMGRFTLTGTHEFPTAACTYKVRVRFSNLEWLTPLGMDPGESYRDVQWATLRGIRWENPIKISGVASIAVRVKASQQQPGNLEKFNCVATSILPDWTGAAWVERETRNLAAMMRSVLQGPGWQRPVADSRIDLTGLQAFSEYCAARQWYFDGVFDAETTIQQALAQIAKIGYASPGMVGDVHGVIQDKEQSTAVMPATPRNSWGYTCEHIYPGEIHGVKVGFINSDTGYVRDEVVAYADGYSASNATKLISSEFWGCSDYGRAHHRAQFLLACLIARPEIHRCNMDFAHLIATRGDRVDLSNDVVLIGLGEGRVKEVHIEPGFADSPGDCTAITLDSVVPMASRAIYGVLIFRGDGADVGHWVQKEVNYSEGYTDLLIFAVPIASGSDDIPAEGDHVQFGEIDRIVSPMTLIGIEPQGDHAAALTMIDHAPSVHDFEAPPAYEPNITSPPEIRHLPPAWAIIMSIQSDETVLWRDVDGSLRARMVCGLYQPSGNFARTHHFEMQIRVYDVEQAEEMRWESAGTYPGDVRSISIYDVEQEVTYDVRIHAVSPHGVSSVWSYHRHEVIGKSTNPPDVTDLELEGRILRWDYDSPPKDLKGFQVRHGAAVDPTWEACTPTHLGTLSDTHLNLEHIGGGYLTFLVCAVDTSGNKSDPVAISGRLPFDDIGGMVTTYDHHAGDGAGGGPWNSYGGYIHEGVIEAGTGDLVGEPEYARDDDLFWGEPGDLFWGEPGDLFWPHGGAPPAGGPYGPIDYQITHVLGAGPVGMIEYLGISHDIEGDNWQLEYRHAGDRYRYWPGKILRGTDTIRVRITIPWHPTVQPRVSSLKLVKYYEQLTEVIGETAIAAPAGTALPLNKRFRSLQDVQLAIKAGDDAIRAEVVNMGAGGPPLTDGPLIKLYDTNDVAVTGSVYATVTGIRDSSGTYVKGPLP